MSFQYLLNIRCVRCRYSFPKSLMKRSGLLRVWICRDTDACRARQRG